MTTEEKPAPYELLAREPVGHVVATVRFPVYEGDNLEQSFDWFLYEEPGFASGGMLGVCRRKCELVGEARVVLKGAGHASNQ